MRYKFLLFLLLLNVAFAADITSVPDADIVTDSWTTAPLFSKIDDNAAAPDGTVIISPLNPTATNRINFSMTETVEGQASQATLIVSARMSSVVGTTSLNLSWFKSTGELIESIDTGTLTGSFALYTGTFSVSVNRTDINSSFLLVIPSSTLPTDEIEIDAVNINLTTANTTLKANGTIKGVPTNKTGENITLEGSCEATGLSSATDVHILLQNSTDNVTFTTISTDNTEPIYANVSFYSFGTLHDSNSSSVLFNVNATKPGIYSLRFQCNGTNTVPREANTSSANFTANQSWGYLNSTILRPSPDVTNSNVARNMNFTIIANVTCVSNTSNPTAICGKVNGTARYNFSSSDADTEINTTQGDVPFWTHVVNKSCGILNATNTCNLNWTINATGELGRQYNVDVLFASENSSVESNNTFNSNITLTTCVVDFSLWGVAIDFGNLPPSTQENPAPKNADNFYNITVNAGSCMTDLYIRGTNLTNLSISTHHIGVGNITWNNVSNDYQSSANLTEENILIKANVPAITNVTTWYWINVPPVYAAVYNGTITISGVESV